MFNGLMDGSEACVDSEELDPQTLRMLIECGLSKKDVKPKQSIAHEHHLPQLTAARSDDGHDGSCTPISSSSVFLDKSETTEDRALLRQLSRELQDSRSSSPVESGEVSSACRTPLGATTTRIAYSQLLADIRRKDSTFSSGSESTGREIKESFAANGRIFLVDGRTSRPTSNAGRVLMRTDTELPKIHDRRHTIGVITSHMGVSVNPRGWPSSGQPLPRLQPVKPVINRDCLQEEYGQSYLRLPPSIKVDDEPIVVLAQPITEIKKLSEIVHYGDADIVTQPYEAHDFDGGEPITGYRLTPMRSIKR